MASSTHQASIPTINRLASDLTGLSIEKEPQELVSRSRARTDINCQASKSVNPNMTVRSRLNRRVAVCVDVKAHSEQFDTVASSDNTGGVYSDILERQDHYWSRSNTLVGRIFRKYQHERAEDNQGEVKNQNNNKVIAEDDIVEEDSSSYEDEEDGASLEFAELEEEAECCQEFEEAGSVTEVSEERDEHDTKARTSGPLKMGTTGQRWTEEEDRQLHDAVAMHGARNWRKVAELLPGRNPVQCNQRWKRLQPDRIRGNWTKEEDKMLMDLVRQYKTNWALIAKNIKGRTGKQVRERYLNTLDPSIVRTKWTPEEDYKLMMLFKELGSVWSEIAKFLPGRSENMVKNRYYSCLKKKYGNMDKEQIAEHVQKEKMEDQIKTKKATSYNEMVSTDAGSTGTAEMLEELSSHSQMSPKADGVDQFLNTDIDGLFNLEDSTNNTRSTREISDDLLFQTRGPITTNVVSSGIFDEISLRNLEMNTSIIQEGENLDFRMASADSQLLMADMQNLAVQTGNNAFLDTSLGLGPDCSCPTGELADFSIPNGEETERIDSGFFKEQEFVYAFDNRSRGSSLRSSGAPFSRTDSGSSGLTELSRISQLLADDQSDRGSKIEQLSTLREQLTNLSELVNEKLGELQTA